MLLCQRLCCNIMQWWTSWTIMQCVYDVLSLPGMFHYLQWIKSDKEFDIDDGVFNVRYVPAEPVNTEVNVINSLLLKILHDGSSTFSFSFILSFTALVPCAGVLSKRRHLLDKVSQHIWSQLQDNWLKVLFLMTRHFHFELSIYRQSESLT